MSLIEFPLLDQTLSRLDFGLAYYEATCTINHMIWGLVLHIFLLYLISNLKKPIGLSSIKHRFMMSTNSFGSAFVNRNTRFYSGC